MQHRDEPVYSVCLDQASDDGQDEGINAAGCPYGAGQSLDNAFQGGVDAALTILAARGFAFDSVEELIAYAATL